jgi:ubiquinone/menaquinone biosynthesis C-methylase UbiE
VVLLEPEKGIHRPFNNDSRRKWQNPEAILSGIGLKPGSVFMDIGCGSGFFTLPAARIVGRNGKIYGLDINADLIASLKEQADRDGFKNVYLSAGKAEESVLCKQCADIVFLGIVLHDLEEPSRALENARRMIKSSGKLVNLDWKKEPMEIGPPVKKRFDEETAMRLIKGAGFKVETVEDSGLYHYLITATP